jgi:hypothetical protein
VHLCSVHLKGALTDSVKTVNSISLNIVDKHLMGHCVLTRSTVCMWLSIHVVADACDGLARAFLQAARVFLLLYTLNMQPGLKPNHQEVGVTRGWGLLASMLASK